MVASEVKLSPTFGVQTHQHHPYPHKHTHTLTAYSTHEGLAH